MTNNEINNKLIEYISDYISNLLLNKFNSKELLDIVNKIYYYSNNKLKLSPINQIEYIDDDYEIIWGQLDIRNEKLIKYVKSTFNRLYKSINNETNRHLHSKRISKSNKSDELDKEEIYSRENIDNDDDSDSNNNASEVFDNDNSESEDDNDNEISGDFDNEEVDNDDDNEDFDAVIVEDDEEEEDDDDDEDNGEYEEEEEDDADEEKEMLDMDMLDDYIEDDLNDDENNNNENESSELTEYQRKQLKLQDKLSEIEKELVQPKKWDMLGEVKAKSRPENSLLEINAAIDIAAKPAPIVTTEFTSSVEDIIKNRIKKQNYNDVVFKNKDVVKKPENEISLSTEKSKVGLGEIYAEEFSKKVVKDSIDSVTKELSKELITEVKLLYDQVSLELDGLCHHFYTPTPLTDEININSLPVVTYEENLPIYTNSNTIDNKIDKRVNIRTLKSTNELTKSDRLTLRNQNKRKMKGMASHESKLDTKINNKMKKMKFNNSADSNNIKYSSSKDVFKAINDM